MNRPPIITANSSDIGQVAALITAGFAELPQAAWLVPDQALRRPIIAGYVRILINHALEHGIIYQYTDGSGAAVWLDRTRPVPPPEQYPRRRAVACGPYTERFQELDELLDDDLPVGPQHQLAFLTVKDTRRRYGLGSALLRHHHERLDEFGVSGCLVAATTDARDFYIHRGGYREPAHHPYLYLPHGKDPFYPMWRPSPRDR